MDFSRKVSKNALGKKNQVKRSAQVFGNTTTVQSEPALNQQAFVDGKHARAAAPPVKKAIRPGIVRPINTQDIKFQRSAIEKRKQEEEEATKQRQGLIDQVLIQAEQYKQLEQIDEDLKKLRGTASALEVMDGRPNTVRSQPLTPSYLKPVPVKSKAGSPLTDKLELDRWAETALNQEYTAIVTGRPMDEMPPWLEERESDRNEIGNTTIELEEGTVLPGGVKLADLFGKKPTPAPVKKPTVLQKQARPKIDFLKAPAVKKPTGPQFLTTVTKAGPGSNLAIKALAGTGKTFTIIEGIKKLLEIDHGDGVVGSEQQEAIWQKMLEGPRAKTIHFAAFNNAIARELESRVPTENQLPDGCSVTVSTIHSLGFKAIKKCGYASAKMSKFRTKTAMLLEEGWDDDHRKNWPGLAPLCEQVTGLIKQNLLDHTFEKMSVVETVAMLVGQYAIETSSENMEALIELLPWLMQEHYDRTHIIDFADMVWFPNVRNECRVSKVDLILVDESQDLNKAQQELVKMAGRRIVMVGDVHQAIYGFAGADSQAMTNMITSLENSIQGCQTLELTYTRRCCQAVVRLAKQLVPNFEALPDAPEGEVIFNREEDGLAHIGENDMVLCRTNAPLISQCLRFLREGKKARMQGRDIGEDLIRLIEQQKEDYTKAMLEKLEDWFGREMERVSRRKIGSEGAIINLQDKYDSILAFSENTTLVQQVIRKINDLFDDKQTEGTLFTSIHRSKGLERPTVVFWQEDKCPHPMARTEQAKEQEYNLRYVGITRAITKLYMTKAAVKKRSSEDLV